MSDLLLEDGTSHLLLDDGSSHLLLEFSVSADGGVAFYLAPDDYALAPSPDWQRIDTDYNVHAFQIDRGRPDEMSRTGPGTAGFDVVDKFGDFDPTNTSGEFYGRLDSGVPMGPLVQAKIELQDPVTEEWSVLFRGFVSRIVWTPSRTEEWANVRIDLVDLLGMLAASEMPLDGSYGDDFVGGNIVFDADASLDAVQTRFNNVLDSFGLDVTLRSVFTGNVGLLQTVYAPRSTVLQVLLDAADAEGSPLGANVYVGGPRNPGKLIFHGRKARFNPTDPDYEIETWYAGDDAAATADPTNVVRVSPPLEASLDDTTLYTSALAAPQGIDDGDYPAQYVQDALSVATKGLRTWSAENLLTAGGEGGTTALEETLLQATYVRDNYATPRVRVGQLTVKGRNPTGTFGAATWAMLTGVDVSDVVHLTTTHGGGGGFDDDFFVEGIHYRGRPGGLVPTIEMTLDVSPAGYYDSDPWTGT